MSVAYNMEKFEEDGSQQDEMGTKMEERHAAAGGSRGTSDNVGSQGSGDDTNNLIQEADNIEDTGVASVHDDKFEAMEEKLKKVKGQLDTANFTRDDVDKLQSQINRLEEQIKEARANVNQIREATEQAENAGEESAGSLETLKTKVDEVRVKYVGMEHDVNETAVEADKAIQKVEAAKEKKDKLETLYEEVETELGKKQEGSQVPTTERAETLKNRAAKLLSDTQKFLTDIDELKQGLKRKTIAFLELDDIPKLNKVATDVLIPEERFQQVDDVHKVLNQRGKSLRELAESFKCQAYIRGRGSTGDTVASSEEEQMKSQDQAEPLHIRIEIEAPIQEAYTRVAECLCMLHTLLKPEHRLRYERVSKRWQTLLKHSWRPINHLEIQSVFANGGTVKRWTLSPQKAATLFNRCSQFVQSLDFHGWETRSFRGREQTDEVLQELVNVDFPHLNGISFDDFDCVQLSGRSLQGSSINYVTSFCQARGL